MVHSHLLCGLVPLFDRPCGAQGHSSRIMQDRAAERFYITTNRGPRREKKRELPWPCVTVLCGGSRGGRLTHGGLPAGRRPMAAHPFVETGRFFAGLLHNPAGSPKAKNAFNSLRRLALDLLRGWGQQTSGDSWIPAFAGMTSGGQPHYVRGSKTPSVARGSLIWKVVPWPGVLWMVIWPSWASTIRLTTYRPMPVPSASRSADRPRPKG